MVVRKGVHQVLIGGVVRLIHQIPAHVVYVYIPLLCIPLLWEGILVDKTIVNY